MKMVDGSGTAFCYWALCSLSFLVVGVSAECEWTGLKVYANSADATESHENITKLEDCQQWCVNHQNTCVGVQFQPNTTPKCLSFAEEPALAPGINSYQYYNYSCPTASSCTMQEVSGKEVTSSTPLSDTITADSDFCKTVCKWTSECTAITYDESTSTCTIHASAVTASNADGNKFSRKTDCDDGKACCFEGDSSNTQGTSSSYYSLDLSDKLQSCKTACENTSPCTALTFSGGRCSLYNAASLESKDQSGSSYYSKSCTGGSLTLAYICGSHGIQLQFSKLLGVLLVAVYTALL